ncbi:DNA-binding protein [Variovorax sp. YR266]|uniref:DNA-binding protein n=1 Tax=Variovorax sp. YR266 TaxID=1884386 RepID=UPI000B81D5A7|nr:DNA-binding protein [Variovorax sp. YR266]
MKLDKARSDGHESATQAWKKFRSTGTTAADWADAHGFSRALVYAVLRGERKCLRGQSHAIAVALGLKRD